MRAALIYQHKTAAADQKIAYAIGALIGEHERERKLASAGEGDSECGTSEKAG